MIFNLLRILKATCSIKCMYLTLGVGVCGVIVELYYFCLNMNLLYAYMWQNLFVSQLFKKIMNIFVIMGYYIEW